MFEIVSLEQESSGRWYARVVISAEETAFFKFQDEPTQSDIDVVAAEFLARRQEVNDGGRA